MLGDPVSQRTIILLHDYHIGVRDDSVIVHGGHPLVKPKVLKAGYFGEDIVKNAALVYTLWEAHFFDGDFSWTL